MEIEGAEPQGDKVLMSLTPQLPWEWLQIAETKSAN